MRPQATRIQPAVPDNSRGEMLGVLLIAAAFGAGVALFHRFLWVVFA